MKKIAWILPYPIKGSGGIRTLVQNINFLVENGYKCDVYFEEDYSSTKEYLYKQVTEYYGKCLFDVFVGIDFKEKYDLIFATSSKLTADYVYYSDIKRKAYFIQDFEPWFRPMGEEYIEKEMTYKYGLNGISIGKWLTHKLSTEYNTNMRYFNFCADLNIYKKLKNTKEEKAVCFIYQPEKYRRCSSLGIKTLMLVKKLRPDIKLYLYGSDIDTDFDFGVENLKIISPQECNELYNKCKVGLCISSTNPSRIPFEMMAAGLPVVDLYRENNFYDMPEEGILLADATPEALATAIIKIIDNESLQKKMSDFGIKYMKNYPIKKGYMQFLEFVEDLLKNKTNKQEKISRLYNNKCIYPSEEVLQVINILKKEPIAVKDTSPNIRKLVKLKQKAKHNICTIVFNKFGK